MWTYRGDEPTVVSWLDDIATAHEAHRRAARLTRRRHRLVGAVTAVFAVATAVVVIVDLLGDLEPWVSIVAGSLAVVTALLALLHAFADDAGQTASHRHAATEYAGLRRQLEQAILSERITDDRLAEIRASWIRLERSSPTLSPRTLRAVGGVSVVAPPEPAPPAPAPPVPAPVPVPEVPSAPEPVLTSEPVGTEPVAADPADPEPLDADPADAYATEDAEPTEEHDDEQELAAR